MKKNIDIIASIIPTEAEIFGYINGEDVASISVENSVCGGYFACIHIVSFDADYFHGRSTRYFAPRAEGVDPMDAIKGALKKVREDSSFDIDAVDNWNVHMYNGHKAYCGYVHSANGEFVDAVHIYIRRSGKRSKRMYTAYVNIVGTNVTYVATDTYSGCALEKAFEKAVNDDFFDFSAIATWLPLKENPYSLDEKRCCIEEKLRRMEEEEAMLAPDPDIFCNIPDDDEDTPLPF